MSGKFTLAALSLVSATSVQANPADADHAIHARNLAGNCTSCHVDRARSSPFLPSLAGVPQAGLLRKLRAFRNGELPATVMHQIARGYTDEQLALIAAHFAARP